MKSLMYRKIAQLTMMDNKGQGLVEYALIIALIAITLIVILGLTSNALNGIFQRIVNALNAA